MPVNFDFNLFDEIVKNAPTAGFGPSATFGKCVLDTIQLVHWDTTQKKFVSRDWNGTDKAAEKEYFQITLVIDLSEINPALDFEWKRRIDIKHNGRTSKGEKDLKNLTDWDETIEPSLLSAIGKDWLKKLSKGVYVEVEDAETVELDKNGNKRSYVKRDRTTKEPIVDEATGKEIRVVNTAPRFIRSFKSKAECLAAREEKYGNKEGEASSDDAVPASYIKDFKGLVESLSLEGAIEVVDAQKPFGEYSGAEIAVAAGFKPPF